MTPEPWWHFLARYLVQLAYWTIFWFSLVMALQILVQQLG